MSLVSTEWLASNFEKVKILDCSWHLPNVSRNSKKEFDKDHLENAIFFDLDDNSEKESDLPHMMPTKKSGKKLYHQWVYLIMIQLLFMITLTYIVPVDAGSHLFTLDIILI